MKKLSSTLCATVAAATIAASAVIPVNAGPMQLPRTAATEAKTAEIQNVRHVKRGKFVRRGDRAYYRGHRGYRKHRRGYRRHNGYWFPPAAFLGGFIIGNAFSQNRGRYYDRDHTYALHVRWCDDRYKSYRVSDDTFQPYHGPRRRCNSPYIRYY